MEEQTVVSNDEEGSLYLVYTEKVGSEVSPGSRVVTGTRTCDVGLITTFQVTSTRRRRVSDEHRRAPNVVSSSRRVEGAVGG